ncbi:LysR family transcriptional regulator [Aquincola sp. S2]|uniref:LysR family transcriptional regulator n=2 Tax=Pseudaquabacterium terrae TaxID=2732868 RepID=A0ABX2E9I9_9BURK|nr:LysR family transcriptional regulator [Aquabacterium terrae]NRF65415.1 LysR family transcriptional regulator [Aquabacterium terrae]
MNLSWLDDFMALAATGNFSRAADERHMTQPAFSRRIRALEEWLGAELFDRSSQPARLTETGHWFRKIAQELQAQVAKVPGEARAIAEASSTTLRFAATHALSFTFLPRWLRQLEAHTNLGPVQLVSDVQQRCEALLLHKQVQFVLAHGHPQVKGPLDEASCPFLVVGSDQLIPVSATDGNGQPTHLIPSDGKAAGLQMLGYSAESGVGRILRAMKGPELERLRAQQVLTAHLASVLRTMALDGRGLAWLPALLIGDDIAAGRLAVAAPDAWRIDLEVRLHRDHAALGRAAEGFWEAAKAASDAA